MTTHDYRCANCHRTGFKNYYVRNNLHYCRACNKKLFHPATFLSVKVRVGPCSSVSSFPITPPQNED
jgi:ribosomal protein L37AE/L43A